MRVDESVAFFIFKAKDWYEYLLKGLIVSQEDDPPESHDPLLLANRLGAAGGTIPKYVRSVLAVVKSYEARARYDMSFVINVSKLDEVVEAYDKWIAIVYKDFIDSAYEVLSKLVPSAVISRMGKEDLVREYQSFL